MDLALPEDGRPEPDLHAKGADPKGDPAQTGRTDEIQVFRSLEDAKSYRQKTSSHWRSSEGERSGRCVCADAIKRRKS